MQRRADLVADNGEEIAFREICRVGRVPCPPQFFVNNLSLSYVSCIAVPNNGAVSFPMGLRACPKVANRAVRALCSELAAKRRQVLCGALDLPSNQKLVLEIDALHT